jgi:hypothetical protein
MTNNNNGDASPLIGAEVLNRYPCGNIFLCKVVVVFLHGCGSGRVSCDSD